MKLSAIISRFAAAGAMAFAGITRASDPGAAINFEQHVRPILKAHCFHCHGEDGETKGDVDLRQRRLMLKTGALKADAWIESSLLEQVRSGEMPKKAKKLPDEDIALIERWLKAGAPTLRPEPEKVPAHFVSEEERAHWAFQPVTKPAPPAGPEAHPIDAFVRATMKGAQLDFAPEADRVALLRRAAIDLHGLPPPQEDVQAFTADTRPDAWERALDRLLASPLYGERWGRHWLDVAGYADSNGGGRDAEREHAWHFRDYVVRAFNADKPWDRFIQEQLAGDELVRFTHERAREILKDTANWEPVQATGFLRMAPDFTEDEPPDEAVAREAVIAENLKVVSSAFLGLSVGCAQCHDHRFDPVSQVDYFRLRAVFEPVFDPAEWRGPSQRQYSAYTAEERAANDAIEARARELDDRRQSIIDREYDKHLDEKLKSVPGTEREAVRAAWHLAEDKRTGAQRELLKKHDCDFEKADHLRYLPDRDEQEEERSKLVKEVKAVRETKLSRRLMAASEVRDQVPVTRRFHRGDHRAPREEIGPGEIALFEEAPEIPASDPDQYSTGRRLAYARWLTGGRHPLTARVLVNRFWFHHFGRGLSPNLNDFGLRSPRPVQAALLDWLAADFVERGWSLKAFHRRVMTSRTYRQGSRNPAAEARDADNTLLARMPARRLEAEAVRDSLLAVAGNLKLGLGGRPLRVARRPEGGIVLGREVTEDNNDVVKEVVPLGDDAARRSIYVQSRRNFPLTVLHTFDMPFMEPNCSQRAVTTVAPQSLMMLNDTFVIEQSRVLARRLRSEFDGDVEAQIRALWQRAFLVPPAAHELEAAGALITREVPRQRELGADESEAHERALAALCQVVFASNRFLYAP
jgi:mono/diheme cytochrome c family protein